jgi:hypothetical protein
VLFDEAGAVQGTTLADRAAAATLARAGVDLLERAAGFRSEGSVTQLEAATSQGSVFVVRDGARRIAATTGPQPTVGLVFYDLKSCLRGLDAEAPKPRRPRRKKPEDDDA